MGILDKLTTTKNYGVDRLKVLVHGPSGAGKTTLMGTTGKDAECIILSAESGLLPLRGKDIAVLEIETLDDMTEAYMFLASGEHKYKWIGVDSISDIAETILNHEIATQKDGRMAYGEMARRVVQLLKRLRDLPYHVIVSAKQERIQDEMGRLIRVPSMPGKQLTSGDKSIDYLFDIVLALRVERDEAGKVIRLLQTEGVDGYAAKDRSGALNITEPPNLAHIFKKISNIKDK